VPRNYNNFNWSQILNFTLTAISQSLNFKLVIFKSNLKSLSMKPIYHSTVWSLDELNELGFTYDYNIHQRHY
jgi:hypothetical protein